MEGMDCVECVDLSGRVKNEVNQVIPPLETPGEPRYSHEQQGDSGPDSGADVKAVAEIGSSPAQAESETMEGARSAH